jgi:hypothetical protein
MPYFRQMQPSAQALPTLPTGVPTGPTTAGSVAEMGDMPAMGSQQPQVPTTLSSPMFNAGFLRTQIGRTMRVEFLIGTNGPLVDRTGVLVGVGASYILLRPIESDDVLMCDIYSIKFVTILL